MKVAYLLVTCCRDATRAKILDQVVANLRDQAPQLGASLTVFDNASTELGTRELLTSSFNNVYQADHNVGFWSAIDWWLGQLEASPPDYVYIIESDLMHRGFDRLRQCIDYLDVRPDVGGVRVHEYCVADSHLYDKDRPHPKSKRHCWRSHTNVVTGKRVEITHDMGDIYLTTFPAHVPALNRLAMVRHAFDRLRAMPHFNEHDFQRACHEVYQKIALLDGGIFYELAYNGAGAVGSFTPPQVLGQMGYQSARASAIVPRDQYNVVRLG